MSRMTKSMLALMIINGVASLLFLTGLVEVGSFPGLYVVFPLAATFYGLFLISRIFQKDMAGFDAERQGPEDQAMPANHFEADDAMPGHEHHEPAHA